MRALLISLCLVSLLGAVWAVPAGKIFFTADWELYSMLPDGTHLTRLTTTGADNPIASRDGKMIAFIGKGGISLLDVATSEIRTIPVEGNPMFLVCISPDNGQLYFLKDVEGKNAKGYPVCALDLHTGKERRTPMVTGDYCYDILSPDGKWMAFGKGTALTLFNPDGKHVKTLPITPPETKEYTGLSEPAFSPDGKHIAFAWTTSEEQFDYGDLFITDVDGKNLKKLVYIHPDEDPQTPDSAVSPRFSPDGKWIAYNGMFLQGLKPGDGSKGMLYVMKADGTETRQLATCNSYFCFSPDSTAIVFMDADNLFTINVDGTGLQQLTKNRMNFFTIWVP